MMGKTAGAFVKAHERREEESEYKRERKLARR